MSALTDRIRTYPLWIRALVGLLAVVALVLVWRDFVWATAVGWNQEVDDNLAELREMTAEQESFSLTEHQVIVSLGHVELPGTKQRTTDHLAQAISRVLEQQPVRNRNVTYGGQTMMRRGSLRGLVDPARQAIRVSYDVRFDSTPEVASAVITELESHPAVESLSSVRMTKSNAPGMQGRLIVNLTVEAWAVPAGAATYSVKSPDQTPASNDAGDQTESEGVEDDAAQPDDAENATTANEEGNSA